VQPGMERGILLGHRHEQPEGEGQDSRASVQAQPPTTISAISAAQVDKKLAGRMPKARI